MAFQFLAKLVCCVMLSLWAVSSLAAEGPVLRIYTEEYPPYNYQEGTEVTGRSTAILRHVLGRMNMGTDEVDICLVPWARAYHETLGAKNTMIYSTVRTQEREDMFIWVGPIATSEIGFVARKADSLSFNSLDDLSMYKVGVVREDVAHQLMKKLKPDLTLDISNSIESNLLKLKEKRIDLFVYDINVIDHLLPHAQLNPNDFEPVYLIDEMDFYFAFNPDTDSDLIVRFQKAFAEVRADSMHP